MTDALILAAPSKGRLKDQVEAWLADCGLELTAARGDRGYQARIAAMPELQVRLASSTDIAAALVSGDVHLGVTGEDLLGEVGDPSGRAVLLLAPLGFGRANLVVAAPKSWIDVETMADLDEVARLFLVRTGGRMRVATKYPAQTRAFFARHGLTDYRLVESSGATEGAPAAGTAELIVDITSSGATLAANGLRPLDDGLIISSQAQLAASVAAAWSPAQLAAVGKLLRIIEARARAKAQVWLTWPPSQDAAARSCLARLDLDDAEGAVLVPVDSVFAVSEVLASAGIGPVTVTRPAYVFRPTSDAFGALEDALAPR